jgi:hypothetical protein
MSELIEFIEEHGLNVKGIFRKSAPVSTIKALQNRINMGMLYDAIYKAMFFLIYMI